VGDDFMEVLSDVLHELPTIEHLNVASNKLSDEGLERLVLVSRSLLIQVHLYPLRVSSDSGPTTRLTYVQFGRVADLAGDHREESPAQVVEPIAQQDRRRDHWCPPAPHRDTLLPTGKHHHAGLLLVRNRSLRRNEGLLGVCPAHRHGRRSCLMPTAVVVRRSNSCSRTRTWTTSRSCPSWTLWKVGGWVDDGWG
jgi:hypothetical protein